MKRTIVILALILINTGVYAQHFQGYERRDEHIFRDYALGLKVDDETGMEIRRTEPLYSKVFYSEEYECAAVCLPLNSLEQGEKSRAEHGRIWICLDYNLAPMFVFPSNTHHLYKIIDGMFIYKDKPEHYSTVGLVDKDGRVVFEAPYERVFLEHDQYVGVKDLTEDNDYSGIRSWAVEFKKKSLDVVKVIRLKTPERESVGLWFEEKNEEDKEWLEQRLKDDSFQRGLNFVVHSRMDEATECFIECLQMDDSSLVRCVEYNLEALKKYKTTDSL
ncbi:MAG: hypothetical protein IK022_06375 [Bacteroidales bacterium]|nr:hypothetical protein [Bacteroidales bacterium]